MNRFHACLVYVSCALLFACGGEGSPKGDEGGDLGQDTQSGGSDELTDGADASNLPFATADASLIDEYIRSSIASDTDSYYYNVTFEWVDSLADLFYSEASVYYLDQENRVVNVERYVDYYSDESPFESSYLIYDDSGCVSEAGRYFKGELERQVSYLNDSECRVLSISHLVGQGYNSMEFEYEQGLLVLYRTFTYGDGFYGEQFIRDDRGRITEVYDLSSEQDPKLSEKRYYEGDSLVLLESYWSSGLDQYWEYEYDSAGLIAEKREYSDDRLIESVTYRYQDGLLVEKTEKDGYGEVIKTTTREYSDNGALVKSIIIGDDVYVYESDANKNHWKEYYYIIKSDYDIGRAYRRSQCDTDESEICISFYYDTMTSRTEKRYDDGILVYSSIDGYLDEDVDGEIDRVYYYEHNEERQLIRKVTDIDDDKIPDIEVLYRYPDGLVSGEYEYKSSSARDAFSYNLGGGYTTLVEDILSETKAEVF